MRSRPGYPISIILVPLVALVALVVVGVVRQAHHTLRHIPQVAQAQLTAALGREVRIGRVEGNFRSGLDVYDIAIARTDKLADGALLRVKHARVRYSLDAVLGGKTPPLEAIRAIEIDDPWLYVSRDPKGRLNLQDLAKPGPPRKGPPPRFLGTAIVRRGTVVFEDHAVPRGRPITHRLTGIDLRLDGRAAPLYAATLRAQGDGARLGPLAVVASVDPERMNASVTARAGGVDIPAWLAYVPKGVHLPAQVERGQVDAEATLLVAGGKVLDYHGRATLREGGIRLPQLRAPLRGMAATVQFTPGSVVAQDVRVQAGNLALSGSATAIGTKDPWVRARVAAGAVREADVRALVPDLPRLPDVRLGQIDRLEIAAVGPLSDLRTRLTFDVTEIARPEATLSGVHVEVRAIGRQQVVVEKLTAQVAGGTLVASGSVDIAGKEPRYTARGTARGIQLEAVRLDKHLGTDAPKGTIGADFQVEGVGARFHARARVDAGGVRWKEWRADTAQFQVAYRDGKVAVERAQVVAPEGVFTAHGWVDLKGPLQLQVSATEVNVTAIGRKIKQEKLRGQAFVRGEVKGTLKQPSFSGEVTAYDLAYGEDRLDMVRGKLTGSMEGIRLEEVQGFMLPARFGEVAVVLSNPAAGPKAELEAVGTIADIDLGVLAQRLGLGGEWGGTIDVEELQVSGPLDGLRLDARVSARRLRCAGQAVDYVAGRFSAGMDFSLKIPDKEPIVARVGTSEVRLWGEVTADQKLDLTLETPEGKSVNIEDVYRFDPAVVALTGTLGIKTRITGTLNEPLVRGEEVTITRLAVNGATFGLGDGRFTASKESVRVNFVLNGEEVADNPDRREVYDVDGTLWPVLDLVVAARMEAAPIQKLLQVARIPAPPIDVRGKITASIRVKGNKPRPDVTLVKLVVEGGGVGPQAIQALTADGIVVEGDVVAISKLHVALPEGATLDVSGKAAITEDGPISLVVSGEKLDLALAQRWVPLEGRLGGVGALQATIGGSRKIPTVEGKLSIEGARLNQFTFDTVAAQLSYRDNVARVMGLRVERRYEDVPAPAAGDAKAEGATAKPQPPGNGDPAGEGARFVATGEAAIPYDWQKRAVPANAPLSAHLVIERQDLGSMLKIFAPPAEVEAGAPPPRLVETVDGALTARVDLAGTIARPDLRGSVLVSASDVIVRNAVVGKDPEEALRLRGLDVELGFERDRIRVERVCVASARPASGKRRKAAATNPEALKLSGTVALKGFAPDQLDLRLEAKDFGFWERNLSAALMEQVEFTLNTATAAGAASAITIIGPWQSPLVAGDVAISRGKVDLTRMGALVPGEPQPFPVNPRFNLRIATPGGVDVMPARTRLLAMVNATVGGSLNAPRVDGTVTSNSGSVSLPTAHFRLKDADIAFRLTPPDPFTATGTALLTTNVRGSGASRKGTETYAITAEVVVDYPADPADPDGKSVRIALTADPTLQEKDIYRLLTRQDVLARLVGGQDANQDVAIDAIIKEEVVNFMATALQPRLFEPVERAIADTLGLSEFSITASFNEPVEIKMGKRLVKGLRVSYTRAVSARDAKFRFRVEYEVLDNVSASWTTDERRSQVLGLEAGIQF